MELLSHFTDFLANIRLPDDLRDECVSSHVELRAHLLADPDLAPIMVTTFLQGSYRRSTITKPQNGSRPDVDVVAVTNVDPRQWSPAQVQEAFCEFLDKHEVYRRHYRRQGRSIGISKGRIDVDLVVTAAPSATLSAVLRSDAIASTYSVEAHSDWRLDPSWPSPERRTSRQAEAALRKALEGSDWQGEPLLIPDRELGRWEQTDPISQIRWTHEKNSATNGHFVNVVRAVKWWWNRVSSDLTDRPKGFLIERVVGIHCPDEITDVASGFTVSLEAIRDSYAQAAAAGETPFVPDIGLPDNDVFKRVSPSAFRAFHQRVVTGAAASRDALDHPDSRVSAKLWRDILGDDFPPPAGGGDGGGTSKLEPRAPRPTPRFVPPAHPSVPRKGEFA